MKNLLFAVILLSSLSLPAQQRFEDSVAAARVKLQTNNMWVLGAWAGANIIQGTISASNTSGSDHYFHQMNAYWNIANLAIAGLGMLAAKKQLAGDHTFARNLREQHQMESLLMLNLGLDAGYLATGLYLKERGQRLNRDQPLGYGNSLLLQGGFLLIFDIIQYAGHRRNGKLLEKKLADWQVGAAGNGLGLTYHF